MISDEDEAPLVSSSSVFMTVRFSTSDISGKDKQPDGSCLECQLHEFSTHFPYSFLVWVGKAELDTWDGAEKQFPKQ